MSGRGSIKGTQSPRVGRVFHDDPRVTTIDATCRCGARQEIPIDSTATITAQLAGESCLFCGMLGRFASYRTKAA